MEWGKQMEKHSDNAKLSLYQNSNYTFERREKKTLIVDSINHKLTDTGGKFTTELTEPLIVDKLSDVYLESFTTFNSPLIVKFLSTLFLTFIEFLKR